MSEYDERVIDYWKISGNNYIVKTVDDTGLEDEVKKLNTMPLHLGSFVLTNSKRIMNILYTLLTDFLQMISTLKILTACILRTNIGINYIKLVLVGKNLLQGKNDYKDGGIFYGVFLAPKIKYCVTINKFGIFDEHKTIKGFTIVSDDLDRKEYFKMINGDKLVAKVPFSWKKSFSLGVVIPHKTGNCNKCTKNNICKGCVKLVKLNKEFSANPNEIKRQPPNEFGHMLPK